MVERIKEHSPMDTAGEYGEFARYSNRELFSRLCLIVGSDKKPVENELFLVIASVYKLSRYDVSNFLNDVSRDDFDEIMKKATNILLQITPDELAYFHSNFILAIYMAQHKERAESISADNKYLGEWDAGRYKQYFMFTLDTYFFIMQVESLYFLWVLAKTLKYERIANDIQSNPDLLKAVDYIKTYQLGSIAAPILYYDALWFNSNISNPFLDMETLDLYTDLFEDTLAAFEEFEKNKVNVN